MINGQEYSFEDIQLVVQGRPITGFEAISYTTTKEKVNVIGRGNKPVARARGTKNFEGSITLHQSEVEAIQATLGRGKDLTDVTPFNVIVAYQPEGGGAIVVDALESVEFTEVPKSHSISDTHMVVELPLIIGDIKYNASKNLT